MDAACARTDARSTTRTRRSSRPHKFIGGPRHARRARRPPRAVPQPRADGARRRHGRLRQPARARLPRRPRASRGGRHAGDRRVDPGRPRVPAQGGRRRRGDPRARGGASSTARSRRGSANPDIEILGNHDARRLSIVSFVVRHDGRYLHHNFVVALLNDLFGIQSRGGCSCAGPYGHRLLGHRHRDLARVRARDRARLRGHQARLGPGELQLLHQRGRVRVHPRRGATWSPATAGGSSPSTAFEPATGLWRHRAGTPEPPLSLHDIRYPDGVMAWPSHRHREPESPAGGLPRRGARDPRPAAAPARLAHHPAGLGRPGLRGAALVPPAGGRAAGADA